MTGALVIIGCGGFGREVLSIVRALGDRWQVSGFVDDDPSDADLDAAARLGAAVLGTVSTLRDWSDPVDAVVAIGDPRVRAFVVGALDGSPVRYPPLVHPDSTLGQDVRLAPGAVVAAGARLSTNISVGAHAHVDQNASVLQGLVVGGDAVVGAAACVTRDVAPGQTVKGVTSR